MSVDTTVQEKNKSYPTDDKLYKKIIKRCWIIADEESLDLRQSYKNVVISLGHQQRFKHTKHGAKSARKANKKVKTIAGRLVREIGRKLPLSCLGVHLPFLKLYQKVLCQKRGDSNKIYSLHEPDVKCYSKGKEHKKFEFGSKASILIDQKTGIIMGAMNFTQTLHDSKTIPEYFLAKLIQHHPLQCVDERLLIPLAHKVYLPGNIARHQSTESKYFQPSFLPNFHRLNCGRISK